MLVELFLTALIVLLIYVCTKKPSNYPPGPWGFPIIGHLPLDPSKFEDNAAELRKKHGYIFSWRIGSKIVVMLCEFKIIKEALRSEKLSYRPKVFGMTLLEDGYELGVTVTNGMHWQTIRRFILHHLRDLGMNKSRIVSAVQFEASEFVKVMKKQAGKPAPIPHALSPAIINVLWQMIAGKRYQLDDEKILKFNSLIQEIQSNTVGFLILDIFPWLEYVVPNFLVNWVTKKKSFSYLSDLLKENFMIDIMEHIANLDENNPKDFIDAYLIEMEKQKLNPNSFMSYDDLVGCLSDLFFGGIETTNLTIIFSIFYLAYYPEVQRKIQKEIEGVLHRDTLVTYADKIRLPYTEAFINEVLRYSSLAPLGGIRTVYKDTTLGGYNIPKDAVIMQTLSEIHFDPKYFDKPNDFRPERFLNSEGKVEIPKEGFFPFGIGKRQCLGEPLVRMELFIFIVTMVQHLEFSAPPGKNIDITPMDIPLFHQPRLFQEVLTTIR